MNTITKEDALKELKLALESQYRNLEEIYNLQLEKQGELYEQLEALRKNNNSIHLKMNDIAFKLRNLL